MAKLRDQVRALPNDAAVCGWCAEFEERARTAEKRAEGLRARLDGVLREYELEARFEQNGNRWSFAAAGLRRLLEDDDRYLTDRGQAPNQDQGEMFEGVSSSSEATEGQ